MAPASEEALEVAYQPFELAADGIGEAASWTGISETADRAAESDHLTSRLLELRLRMPEESHRV